MISREDPIHQEAYPTDPASSYSQGTSEETKVAVPTVLPPAQIPTHTLPGALAQARETTSQQRQWVFAQAWAQSLIEQLNAEKVKGDRLQQELTDSRVSCARLDEQLKTATHRRIGERVAEFLGGGFVAGGIAFAIEGKVMVAFFWFILGALLVGSSVVKRR